MDSAGRLVAAALTGQLTAVRRMVTAAPLVTDGPYGETKELFGARARARRARLSARGPYDEAMSGDVTADPGRSRVSGPGWSLRAERVEPSDDGGWRALIGVRKGLVLLVTADAGDDQLDVAAWAGEPEESDGVAVIEAGGGAGALALVPLCTCGERGCGNAGVQLSKLLAGAELPALVGLLRELPWTQAVPARSDVLRGGGLAAIPSREPDPAPPGSWYACAPLAGEYVVPDRPAEPGSGGVSVPPR
jgi:hypothetical protein